METLNEIMEFGRVIEVLNGEIRLDTPTPYAPDLYWTNNGEPDIEPAWTLLDGFSGQFRYSGPIMHESEYIGGRMEDHIRTHDGIYCAVVCVDLDDPENPVGWAVAYREA